MSRVVPLYGKRALVAEQHILPCTTWADCLFFTVAWWCHTECAELVDGFDDAVALFCACAAAPLAFQRDVQQLLLFRFHQRDAHAQLLRERGCTRSNCTRTYVLICKDRSLKCVGAVVWLYFSDLPSSGMGSISQGLIFSVSPLSQLDEKTVLTWVITPFTTLFCKVLSHRWHTANTHNLKWMPFSNKVFKIKWPLALGADTNN